MNVITLIKAPLFVLQAEFVRNAEAEHRSDINAGIDYIIQAGVNAESAQRQKTYSTKEGCEKEAIARIYRGLRAEKNLIELLSQAKHDWTGEHTYKGP